MIDDVVYFKLRAIIDENRYSHSLGVQKTAFELAVRYGADPYKASLAGLIHDCAKGYSDKELCDAAKRFGISLNEVYIKQPGLLHGPVGAYVARYDFKIDDDEMLHAIMHHTTGCKGMNLLDKIIYIADYIEPGRDFPGVKELRTVTYNNIDRGVLLALNNTIKYVIQRNQLIDCLTIEARNHMLLEGNV